MKELRFAVLGCGFWSRFQIAAWEEINGVKLVALYNRTPSKAEVLAHDFQVPRVYGSAEKLLRNETLDFVDIITSVQTHERFVLLAAQSRLPVICQKPMAPDYETARRMVKRCKEAGIPFMIHENWRWQAPIRALKTKLDSGVIGRPFRAGISYCNSFPVVENQPFLAEAEQFILLDMGSHILDVARFLFGEAKSIYCQTNTVKKDIKGEDVASVALKMKTGLHCNVELSYASRLENERFPETYFLIEGEEGSIELAPDFWLRTTTRDQTVSERILFSYYKWVDLPYAVVHSSIVEANRDFYKAILKQKEAETTAEDNLKTVQLVFSAYQSAKTNSVITIQS